MPVGGGANPPGGGPKRTILQNFPKHCMQLQIFGPLGWGGHPLDLPMLMNPQIQCAGHVVIEVFSNYILNDVSLYPIRSP